MRTIIAGVLLAVAVPAAGQVEYLVSFPNAVHHEAQVQVTFLDVPDGPLQVRMSRSSPGRYALHEFGKNVYSVEAIDGEGNPLDIARPDPYQWDVYGHDGVVTLMYTLFADRGGGTYSQVDLTHAHLNMPATFMWARGLEDQPIRITFMPPDTSDWKIATQLFPTEDELTFTAPNLYYFLDSPTELSNFSLRTWMVEGNEGLHTMRIALHHDGTEAEFDEYASMVQKVVLEEIAVFGEPPNFDTGTYTFIADYLPHVSGDGMEHRNSTILASTSSLAERAVGLLGTVSHEFFHAWNVERIRPRSLEPFDFERANMSDALWFAEGFTSYYTPLFIVRANIISAEDFAGRLAGGINFVVNSPARRFFTPREMSMRAPFVDAATAIDPTSFDNTFISYYTWGSVIGLNLDLTLRSRFGLTLDDYMKEVWNRFGKNEVPYVVEDLQVVLGEFTSDAGFAEEFFSAYVSGADVPDYAELLAHAGMIYRAANPDAAWLGNARLRDASGGVEVATYPWIDDPLYVAGISRGAVIESVNGVEVASADQLRAMVAEQAPGDVLHVRFVQRGRAQEASVALVSDPFGEVVLFEAAGREVTEDILRFRESWLGSRVN